MQSLNIQLSEPTYAALRAAAQRLGMSVETFAADRLEADFTNEVPAGFWSPERMAEIDAAAAEARAGESLTMEQVDRHFAARRQAWRPNGLL